MGLVRDEDVVAMAKLDKVDVQMELNKLADIISAKF